MEVVFAKYQGTGNDFIMLDNLDGTYNKLSLAQVISLCDRRFGVGADGLIRINAATNYDFEVDYFNSDGSKSFCGNGARCAVAFAETLGIPVAHTNFMAMDGEHRAFKLNGSVKLEMKDVLHIEQLGSDYILDTGSPHYVHLTEEMEKEDIRSFGKKIRFSERFHSQGINVNLLEEKDRDHISIATYERGVEDETLSCGTGATACAIVYGALKRREGLHEILVDVKGGQLQVGFSYDPANGFTGVSLTGPAEFVFSGKIRI